MFSILYSPNGFPADGTHSVWSNTGGHFLEGDDELGIPPGPNQKIHTGFAHTLAIKADSSLWKPG